MIQGMKRIMCLIIWLPTIIQAQSNKGIKFLEGLNWHEIQAKAKAENKYIFIDCFATWCGPCKQMDKDIFLNEEVGNYINEKFISIKVQMDTTMQDDEIVRKWYDDAHNLLTHYKITGYPTFLFFSPNGKVVHRDDGAKKIDDFIAVARAAIDSNKQYYTLVERYRRGQENYTGMVKLALAAQKFGDDDFANIVAKDYKLNYLDKVNDSEVFTKDNFEFIGSFPALISSKDRIFNLVYNRSSEVDKILNLSGFADNYIRYIIKREEIEDKLWHNNKPVTKKPDWKKIGATIAHKYNTHYSESIIPEAQMSYYKALGNWRQYVVVFEDVMKKKKLKVGGTALHSFGDSWGLNVASWAVFLYSTDRWALLKALGWIELAIKLEPQPEKTFQYLDTKANLLYKLGKVNEAIEFEKEAIAKGVENDRKAGIKGKFYLFDEYSATIEKMKMGEPTWDVTGKN